jgi:hypothetical protein
MKAASIRSIICLFSLVLLSFSGLDAQVSKRFDRNAEKQEKEKETNQEEDQTADEQVPAPVKPAKKINDGKGFQWANMTYGGAVWLSFGTFTYVLLNPRIGYYVTDKLLTGIGVTYIYSKDSRFVPALEQSVYGVNPFVNYEVFRGFGLGAELDMINADVYVLNPYTNEFEVNREWVPHLFLGATYFPRGQGGFIGVYWNVLDEPRSFYSNPVIRFGFMF